MAAIDLTSGTAGAYGSGELQLQGKVQMTSTLTPVTDNLNVASPLLLSTTLVQTTSTLKITTNDNPYIDAEDGAGNNRFTVGRDTGSQQVNVDFASNPGGSTTIVGAIRTYVDGVNLSEVMAFREDGNVGIGTTSPGAKLDIHSASNVIAQFNRTGAGKSWIQFQQAGTARWNTGYDNTNGNFTIYDAVNAADRMVVTNAGNVGIGTSSPTNKLDILGITQIFDSRGTSPYDSLKLIGGTSSDFPTIEAVSATSPLVFKTNSAERMRITSAGNVGIGTSTPAATLDVASRFLASSNDGNAEIVLNSTSNRSPLLYFKEGSTQRALIYSAAGTNNLIFQSGTTEAMRIDSSGNVGIGTSTPVAKLEVAGTSANTDFRISRTVDATANLYITAPGGATLTSIFGISGTDIFSIDTNKYIRLASASGGIQFNGDTAAANALDDYEEGTWTISAAPSSTGTITLDGGVNAGSYTKIGRQVTVTGLAEVSSVSSPTGTAVIFSGLPFAIAPRSLDYDSRVGGAVSVNQGGTSSAFSFQGFENQSSFNVNINASTISAGNQFYISFTYIV